MPVLFRHVMARSQMARDSASVASTLGQELDAVISGPTAGPCEIVTPLLDGREEPGTRVGADAGRVAEPPRPGLHLIWVLHFEGRIGAERGHHTRGQIGCGDLRMPVERVRGIVARAHELHAHHIQDYAYPFPAFRRRSRRPFQSGSAAGRRF